MGANALEFESLLLSRRLEHITHDPFCFFYLDDYLPADFYQSLLQSFPNDEHYRYDSGGKLGFRSSVDADAVENFCAHHPQWRALVDFFGSDAFLNDIRETFRQGLFKARGLPGLRTWTNCTRREVPHNWLAYQFREPVRTSFQFSLLPRGAEVVPHADAPRKLVSLLLYLRDPEWEDSWGGGTEFYVPLDPRRARRWGRTERIPFEEFKRIDTTAFVGNRLAGFVRSDRSYHGVRPVSCPPGMARKALLINVKRVTWAKRAIP